MEDEFKKVTKNDDNARTGKQGKGSLPETRTEHPEDKIKKESVKNCAYFVCGDPLSAK